MSKALLSTTVIMDPPFKPCSGLAQVSGEPFQEPQERSLIPLPGTKEVPDNLG